MTKLILTSDDFGLSIIFNERMIEMLKSNLLSSISVLVDKISHAQQNQLDEIKLIYRENNFSLGLHLEVQDENNEISYQRQWDKFKQLFSLTPDYVDVHKGHSKEVVFDSIARFCLQKGVRFRKYKETTVNVSSPDSSLTVTFKELDMIKDWIASCKINSTNELVFHIGSFDANSKSTLNKERELDIEKLKLLHKFILDENISIVSYKSLSNQIVQP